MKTIISHPKNQAEAKFILKILQRMKVKSAMLNDDEVEEIGLGMLLKASETKERVTEDEVLKSLS